MGALELNPYDPSCQETRSLPAAWLSAPRRRSENPGRIEQICACMDELARARQFSPVHSDDGWIRLLWEMDWLAELHALLYAIPATS